MNKETSGLNLERDMEFRDITDLPPDNLPVLIAYETPLFGHKCMCVGFNFDGTGTLRALPGGSEIRGAHSWAHLPNFPIRSEK